MSDILVIAPHADDETLGVGGTLARAASLGLRTTVAVMTGHGDSPHPLWQPEAWDLVRAEARVACLNILGVDRLIFRDDLPAAILDAIPGYRINNAVREVIEEVRPMEVYVPFIHDAQRDHELIAHACMLALRPYMEPGRSVKRVLAYEVLSETHLKSAYLHSPFEPNVYVDISQHLQTKLRALGAYQSQLQQQTQPRSVESIEALAHLRGSAIGAKAAEAFLLLRETFR